MSDRILVSTRKGLFGFGHGASGWTLDRTAFLGDHVALTFSDRRDQRLYAALHHGHFGDKMHRSEDGGATWEECTVPAYPQRPDDAEDRDANLKEDVPWSLKLIWALAAGEGDAAGDLWCGTIPGGLFRSRDGGDSWQLTESLWNHEGRGKWFGGGADLPGIHSVCVDPRDASRIAVGVSCGGVWVTTDDGATWACRADGMRAEYMPPEQSGDPGAQDPHMMVRCPASPDVLWVQHHNGIFKTTDDCASWSEIENVQPSAFGFGVAVHPEDPDTAWFVPAIKDEKRIPVDGRLVVTRTRDGGQTFDILTEGLPQEHAYDLVFRHALAIDETGDRLAFGTTTGNVFVSDNGGESWVNLTRHLPPVYAVCFA